MSDTLPPVDLDEDAYRTELLKAHGVRIVLEAMPLDAMLRAIAKAEAIGPFFHPTAWIQNAQKMREDKAVIEALRDALARMRRAR